MEDKTVDYYITCFSSESGKRVLANLLIEAKFFDYEHTAEDQAVSNFVKTILTKTGKYNIENIDRYVTDLMNLPRIERKENE
jgi:hypothetical protein